MDRLRDKAGGLLRNPRTLGRARLLLGDCRQPGIDQVGRADEVPASLRSLTVLSASSPTTSTSEAPL